AHKEVASAHKEVASTPPIPSSISTYVVDERVSRARRHRASARRSYDSAFEAWWELFPEQHRVAKWKVADAYDEIIRSGVITVDELIDAVRRYAVSDDVARGYACAPLRWLNEERWHQDHRQVVHGPSGPSDGIRKGAAGAAAAI